jgi:hypothetical protein
MVRLPGGANNQVFRMVTPENRYVLKRYFRHPGDPRDRLNAEYGFVTFAWSMGLRCIPRPVACDAVYNLGLYEYIDGRALMAHEITVEKVEEALDFYTTLNRYRVLPQTGTFPFASEACFSLDEHLRCVQKRIDALTTIERLSNVEHKVVDFIVHDLIPVWRRVRDRFEQEARAHRWNPETTLLPEDRRLSPSDFGFHNAILPENGLLRFIDFEYAGWDDPAKVVCDFFCQPALPVPSEHYELFADTISHDLTDPAAHRRRFDMLMPVYQMKWCCVVLNEFLPAGMARRRFADETGDEEERKVEQLRKARQMLEQVRESHNL